MYGDYDLREVCQSVGRLRREAEQLLADNGLQPDLPAYYLGAYDSADRLVAGAGLEGNVIKCLAINCEQRGEALANRIISRLLERAVQNGHDNVFVFTKPPYAELFASLSFHLVGQSPDAVLLESNPRGIAAYRDSLKALRRNGRCGVAVMNCNPMTQGHLYLIRQAVRKVDTLFIIPLNSDHQEFTYAERRAILQEELKGIPQAVLCPGSDYLVSPASFPTYFIKEASRRADAQIALDCDIFNRHIAPSLQVCCRFVGSEPQDAATARYNELMMSELQVDTIVTERLATNGQPISASTLRRALHAGHAAPSLPLAAPAAVPYVLAHAAAQALYDELHLSPKPGLVQPDDCGSHSDMDFSVMRRGIQAIQPYLVQIALSGFTDKMPSISSLQSIGLKAEAAMLQATNGVNTHKGALFALGITLAVASHCYQTGHTVCPQRLSSLIAGTACRLSPATGTHGHTVRAEHHVAGALDMAQSGYAPLFGQWLPYYRSLREEDPLRRHKLLLKIMCGLDDTNIYHRGGPQAAHWIQSLARETLPAISTEKLREMNAQLKTRHLSPGGSADMLALTLFIHSITSS